MIKKCIIIIMFLLAVMQTNSVYAATKQDDITALISLTFNREQISAGLFTVLINILPEENNSQQHIKNKINNMIDDVFIQQYIAAVVPLYDSQFTHKEIKQLLKFEQSGLGKKTRDVIPTIMEKELMVLVELMEKHTN
ncbi:hypothetical protein DID76_00145 [Candidatus Marinamargulisbacteria bacterium SCGC AG-414-C22]|nr:hypothetical protein DID76_00145 [Candidatus Marinamargulisbacteria bacterium SCGC AG-414-C22]